MFTSRVLLISRWSAAGLISVPGRNLLAARRTSHSQWYGAAPSKRNAIFVGFMLEQKSCKLGAIAWISDVDHNTKRFEETHATSNYAKLEFKIDQIHEWIISVFSWVTISRFFNDCVSSRIFRGLTRCWLLPLQVHSIGAWVNLLLK
jgi:hypothetical protein